MPVSLSGDKNLIMKIYDCIVVGTGAVGSAALYYAAKKGWSVVGLDRFPIAHARGSSHGKTRIIRQAYFEHPNYVPLLKKAYQIWHELEMHCDQCLFERTGLLQVGPSDGPIIGGIRQSAREHGLPIVEFDSKQLGERFPLFHVPCEHVGLFEEVAGFLHVERCVEAMTMAATSIGAELVHGVSVLGWNRAGDFQVTTDQATFRGKRLIFCPGAWAEELLGEQLKNRGVPLKVIRKHQHWFQLEDDRATLAANCPTFFFETQEGYFYGFPAIDDEGGVKLAEHSGEDVVTDPLNINRDLDQLDLSRVQHFMHQYFNSPRGVHINHSVCMYTMTADEHFIVDILDNEGLIAVACGMSGHGFKFAPLIGKNLVRLLEGQREPDMEFLSLGRFNGST